VQHLHYPEFFSLEELARRETAYPMACRLAHTIIVGSRWIKRDILRHYRVSPSKVQVIPLAPPTLMYPEPTERQLADVAAKYQLKRPFMFYPAVTWPHKNHIRLFHALVRLRESAGLRIPLICTGFQDPDSTPAVLRAVKRLDLSDQVRFLANALARVHTDAQLRKELARRGYERVSDFSWERTAMAYRAVYRRAARQTLSEEDRRLLAWDWMREPRRPYSECVCRSLSIHRTPRERPVGR
jgi:glycosyltransferase involved in cell wall biosynthesis